MNNDINKYDNINVKHVISIVGKSNSGKTTLIEKMIPLFIEKKYRTGTIKHHLHDYDSDIRGKDSWRHQNAGARQTMIASPSKLSFFSHINSELPLDKLLNYFDDSDIIITDGYKKSCKPKIEVFRPSHSAAPVCGPDDNLIAIATDAPEFKYFNLPVLNLNDAMEVANFILDFFKLPHQK